MMRVDLSPPTSSVLSVLGIAAVALSACSAINVVPSPTGHSAPTFAAPPSPVASTFPVVPVTMADAASCPRTLGTSAPESIPGGGFFGAGSSFGNGKLWVGGLWPDGIIEADPRFVDAEGAASMKFGWWRVEPGKLTITGKRADASAPPASGDAPDGYGDVGFQASGVSFPTEGCWVITGTVGGTSLTFVTFVIKVGASPSLTPSP
jgi:hypothetical protein